MFDGFEDIPVELLSRRAQRALGGLLEKSLKLGKTKGYELVFIYLPGCGACAAAKPAYRRFAAKHRNIKTRAVSLAKLNLPASTLNKLSTPIYVLKKPNGRTAKTEGAFETLMELELWIGSNL